VLFIKFLPIVHTVLESVLKMCSATITANLTSAAARVKRFLYYSQNVRTIEQINYISRLKSLPYYAQNYAPKKSRLSLRIDLFIRVYQDFLIVVLE